MPMLLTASSRLGSLARWSMDDFVMIGSDPMILVTLLLVLSALLFSCAASVVLRLFLDDGNTQLEPWESTKFNKEVDGIRSRP